ncbi:MAG: hypothetical protein ACRDP4_10455, partial [Nocardioidaceae bacterium]
FLAHVPTAGTVVSFGLGGMTYGPFVALSITLVQGTSPPEHPFTVLAARGAALLTASPLGTRSAVRPRRRSARASRSAAPGSRRSGSVCWPRRSSSLPHADARMRRSHTQAGGARQPD